MYFYIEVYIALEHNNYYAALYFHLRWYMNTRKQYVPTTNYGEFCNFETRNFVCNKYQAMFHMHWKITAPFEPIWKVNLKRLYNKPNSIYMSL